MSKPKIVIVGGGGHCRSCIDVIEQDGRFDIAGFVDKKNSETQHDILGYPLLGCDDDLGELRLIIEYAVIAVGQIKSAATRTRIHRCLSELEFFLPVIVSPYAYVSRHARVGAGTVVLHHATINAAASVGVSCIINSHSLVEHDAVVEDFCHVSTGAIVNGQAVIGAGSFIGSGAIVVNGEIIPPNSFVKANRVFYKGKTL